MNIEVVKEIRFAVVMYGGVSLAIYINGVAQELMRMVRATAVTKDANEFRFNADELDETEKLYRILSVLLGDENELSEITNSINEVIRIKDAKVKKIESENNKSEEIKNKEKKIVEKQAKEDIEKIWINCKTKLENKCEAENGETSKIVRFVVDVISGSSAGGINGIYMAKALAGGQPINRLEKVWKEDGDFTRLLCDEESISDITENKKSYLYEVVKSPPSLLNSQRMYIKLLRAFYDMDDEDDLENDKNKNDKTNDGQKSANSFVDEVDLFVTTTDFWGIPVPIRLFDQIIYERRHRQNFHLRFRKDEGLNEFADDYYPFLAYIARCTSSFPLAFDPTRFDKIGKIIGAAGDHLKPNNLSEDKINDLFKDNLKRFFRPETVQDSEGNKHEIEWKKRIFVDGGALDNKPFEYALQALNQKQSDVLVERKLIYIEPQPESDDPAEGAKKSLVPGVISNVYAQAMNLPGYETISEDLHQVLQRNRLVTRVNHLVSNARRDELNSFRLCFDDLPEIIQRNQRILTELKTKYPPERSENDEYINWEKARISELAQIDGQNVYSYYRLRIAALTDDLARMVTQRAGYDENSDYFLAVRDLVHIWREKHFSLGEEDNRAGNKTVSATRNKQLKTKENQKSTPLQFLRDYDYNYRLRRLHFVLQQADRLLRFDDDLQSELKKSRKIALEFQRYHGGSKSFTKDEKKALQTKFSLIEIESYDRTKTPHTIILKNYKKDSENLKRTVRRFKQKINAILRDLRRNLRQVEPNAVLVKNQDENQNINYLNDQVKAVAQKIGIKELEYLLGKTKGQGTQIDAGNNYLERRNRAKDFLEKDRPDINEDLTEIGNTLKTIYNDPETSFFAQSRDQAYQLFNPPKPASEAQTPLREEDGNNKKDELYKAVRAYLWHFYDNFDAYDQIVFPVTYETPIGKASLIDVARISPLDATNLINESEEKRKQDQQAGYKARRKVAGVTFRAFGAFFAGKWRKNDILWGKLDGAERLVSIVLNSNLIPNEPAENSDNGAKQEKTFEKPLIEMRGLIINELHSAILEESDLIKEAYERSEKDDLITFVREEYSIDRSLPKKDVMENVARSVKVLRKVAGKEDLGNLRKIIVSGALFGLYLLVLICTPGGIVSRLFNFFVFLFLAAGLLYLYKVPTAFQLNIIPGMELFVGIPVLGALIIAGVLIFTGRRLISKTRNFIVNKISGN